MMQNIALKQSAVPSMTLSITRNTIVLRGGRLQEEKHDSLFQNINSSCFKHSSMLRSLIGKKHQQLSSLRDTSVSETRRQAKRICEKLSGRTRIKSPSSTKILIQTNMTLSSTRQILTPKKSMASLGLNMSCHLTVSSIH